MDKENSLLDDFHTHVNHNICLATCLTGKTTVMEASTYMYILQLSEQGKKTCLVNYYFTWRLGMNLFMSYPT